MSKETTCKGCINEKNVCNKIHAGKGCGWHESKGKELKPCPCGGKMELLNDQRHLTQRVSRERFELVCADCGLTVRHPSKSTHKLIRLWNTRLPDTGLVDAVKEFARKVIAAKVWTYYELDGLDVQELAVELKLLEPFTVTEDSVDEEFDLGVGDTGYKFTDILKEQDN